MTRRTPSTEVDVLVAPGSTRAQPGIRLHTTRSLDPRDTTTRHGLRTTTVERALLDCADEIRGRELESLLDEAIGLRSTTPEKLRAQLARSRGRHGGPALEALLARDYTARTREEFERRTLAFLRATRLEHPLVNHRHGRWTLDFYWPRARFVVEADSRAWHSTVQRQKRDAAKDRDLARSDIEVRRLRWWELADEPLALAAELATTIARRTLAYAGG
jgi:very-short-patch-repair endonuclease